MIWCRLRIVCPAKLPRFVEVCDKSQGSTITLPKVIASSNGSHCHRRRHPDRRGQRTSVANRQHVEAVPVPAFTLHLVGQPVSAPLGHRPVAPDIFGRHLPPIPYQVLRDRARVLPLARRRSERALEATRGGAQIDGRRTRGEQVVEERGDVRSEGFGRGEEFGRDGVVGS